eukprot:1157635-Pelagomonas_calceolata.AAC.2
MLHMWAHAQNSSASFRILTDVENWFLMLDENVSPATNQPDSRPIPCNPLGTCSESPLWCANENKDTPHSQVLELGASSSPPGPY